MGEEGDDSDPAVHPGAVAPAEGTYDPIDEDCDGVDGSFRLLIVKGFDIPWDDPTKW